MKREPLVLLHSFVTGAEGNSYVFSGLITEIVATRIEEVLPALARVEAMVEEGHHAVGFLSYEASSGLNSDLVTRPPCDLPLLWFAVYRERLSAPADFGSGGEFSCHDWQPAMSGEHFSGAINRIRDRIAAGETYQVNFTFPIHFSFSGDPAALYREICRSQPTPFCAFIDLGRYCILSASPELFFRLSGNSLTVRPMKGTARRGRWPREDVEAREKLCRDAKERAENLMIVDLLRNDLGMVAATGSVSVPSLFDVETLPSVHQMTSTVTARIPDSAGMVDVLRALFPCGSITGAPKRRTMEIINELEIGPRGLYTGCIGYISPGRDAVFSVAIRTLVLDMAQGRGTMGVGSGVTYDSTPESEYQECLAKSAFVRQVLPAFQLIETILYEPRDGYFLLEGHLDRLRESASYWAFPCDLRVLRERLSLLQSAMTSRHRIRILLDSSGAFTLETYLLEIDPPDSIFKVALVRARVDSGDRLLYHKTTARALYQEELARRPDCLDVLFCNEAGELTEGTMHNLVLKRGGRLVTPPLRSGLLPGVFRAALLAAGEIEEEVILPEDLARAGEIYLINSVRKWRRVRLID